MNTINLRAFLLENQDILYNPEMPNHDLNLELIDEFKQNILKLPEFEIDEKEDLLSILNTSIEIYKELSFCLVDNIMYVSFDEYFNTLKEICYDIIEFVDLELEKEIVFYIQEYKKSSFWVFLLCCPFFIREDIPIRVVNQIQDIQNAFIIYPDDMSYSGSQIEEAISGKYEYLDALNQIRKNGNTIVLLLSRISRRAIKTLEIDENKDIFYLSKEIIIIESVMDRIEACQLKNKYDYLKNLFKNFSAFLYSKKTTNDYLEILHNVNHLILEINEQIYSLQTVLLNLLKKDMTAEEYNQLPIENMIVRFIAFFLIRSNAEFSTNELLNFMNNKKNREKFLINQYGLYLFLTKTRKFLFLISFLNKSSIIFNRLFDYNTLICFQHKMADAISIPMFLFHNGAFISYENNEFEFKHVGSFFRNCPKYDTIHYAEIDIDEIKRCPPTYYKKIKYTYQGQPIDLKHQNIEFTYDYYG